MTESDKLWPCSASYYKLYLDILCIVTWKISAGKKSVALLEPICRSCWLNKISSHQTCQFFRMNVAKRQLNRFQTLILYADWTNIRVKQNGKIYITRTHKQKGINFHNRMNIMWKIHSKFYSDLYFHFDLHLSQFCPGFYKNVVHHQWSTLRENSDDNNHSRNVL